MSGQILDLQIMAKRLEKMEKENRRLKLIATLVLLFVGVIFLMGQSAPKNKIVSAD